MTEASQKAVALRPEEWRAIIKLALEQTHAFVVSIQPLETGASGVDAQHIDVFDEQLARLSKFMRAWAKSRIDLPRVGDEVPAEPVAAAQNGVHEPQKKRGGWPKGRKRAKPQAEAPQ
jgi:hypothetical protein